MDEKVLYACDESELSDACLKDASFVSKDNPKIESDLNLPIGFCFLFLPKLRNLCLRPEFDLFVFRSMLLIQLPSSGIGDCVHESTSYSSLSFELK